MKKRLLDPLHLRYIYIARVSISVHVNFACMKFFQNECKQLYLCKLLRAPILLGPLLEAISNINERYRASFVDGHDSVRVL